MLDTFLRLKDVLTITGLGRSTLYERIAVGAFPAPIKLGTANAWVASEIEAWQQTRIAERDAGKAA